MTEFYIIEEKKNKLLLPVMKFFVFMLLFYLVLLWSGLFAGWTLGGYFFLFILTVGQSAVPFTTYFSYLHANRNKKYTFNYQTNSLDIEKEGEVRSVKFTEFKEVFLYGGSKEIYNRDTYEIWTEFYHFKIKLKSGEKIFITSLTDIPVYFTNIPIKIKRRMRMVRIAI